MSGTRFKLIGECVVYIVKAPDLVLRKVLPQLKQLNKIKKKAKRRSKKQIAAFKKMRAALKKKRR